MKIFELVDKYLLILILKLGLMYFVVFFCIGFGVFLYVGKLNCYVVCWLLVIFMIYDKNYG